MSKAPAFQFYSADFLIDTQDWTVEEIGIYIRLLAHEWVNGCLPIETERLARIAGCSLKKFQFGWEIIQKKFIPNGEGKIVNKRLEQTRDEQQKFVDSQREKGKKRAAKMWEGHIATAKPRLQPDVQPEDSSSSSSSLEEKKEYMSPTVVGNGNCPHQEIIKLYHEHLPMLRSVRIWNEKRQSYLKARWNQDKEYADLSWWEDYFTYVKSCPFLIGENKDGWQADLEWLVTAGNFVKVIEGNYEPRKQRMQGYFD